MKRPHTWGSIFDLALARGCDHGYAAFTADRWEARKKREKMKTLSQESTAQTGQNYG